MGYNNTFLRYLACSPAEMSCMVGVGSADKSLSRCALISLEDMPLLLWVTGTQPAGSPNLGQLVSALTPKEAESGLCTGLEGRGQLRLWYREPNLFPCMAVDSERRSQFVRQCAYGDNHRALTLHPVNFKPSTNGPVIPLSAQN